jgi:lipoate-protein ligase A
MIWLGRHLRDVLHDRLDVHGLRGRLAVHEGRYRPGRASEVLCFDGLGAGEVTLDGSKLVGISQRRTRGAARLQCSWYSSFDWRAALDLLAPQHRPRLRELAAVATVPAEIEAPGASDIATDIATDLAARLSDSAT